LSPTSRSRQCSPGALMSASTILIVQGFTLFIVAMEKATSGALVSVAGVSLTAIEAAVIGTAEIVASALLIAGYRSGGPLGVASAAFLVALAGLKPLSGELARWTLSINIILALLAITLLAAGWGCIGIAPRSEGTQGAAGVSELQSSPPPPQAGGEASTAPA
jgi:hypothetical protein